MSYAFTIPLRGLGITVPGSASANVAVDVKTGAPVSTTVKDTAEAAGVQLPDCSSAALTGNSYLDSTLVKCCEDIKKMSNMSTKEKAIGVGQCVARGAATAACMAAGVVTYGVTTVLAPLCGTVGAMVYNRVMGWSKGQWIAAGIGSVAGPIGSFVAAELAGWLSDSLGPVIDGIFNPSAAKDRELAARKAFHSLASTNEKLVLESNRAAGELWSNSIKSIKDVYQGAIGLLPSVYQAKAQQILGFAPKYDGIAKAIAAAGAPITPMGWPVGNGATVGDRVRMQRDRAGYGCEGSAAGCMSDGYSEVCPFSFSDMYMALYYEYGMDKLKGNTRDAQVAFEKKALQELQVAAGSMLPAMQQAIAVVATKVATVVIGIKEQALLDAAKAKDEAKWVATIVAAAKSADLAADEAKSWNSTKRNQAVLRAKSKYESVSKARFVLIFPGAKPLSEANRKKVNDAVARATAAAQAAQSNAQTAQLMIGATATAGVVGIGYLLLRRT